MRITRTPGPVLQSVVERFWAIDPDPGVLPTAVGHERVLPTGQMHLAFRLSGGPLQLFVSDTDRTGHSVAEAVVGGARTASYLRDVSRPAQTVGAQLRPGAAEVLFGAPALELAERHTPLDDLWPGEVDGILEQLASAATLHQRIDRLETILAVRLAARGPLLHPAVATALRQLPASPGIGRIVRATGYSHRTLIALFRRSVGLTPGDYRRMLRFRATLGMITSPRAPSLAAIAADAGYSDQAHLTREFHTFAGVTPGEYRRRMPERPFHVAAGQFRSRPPGRPALTSASWPASAGQKGRRP
jgi:AraC-like DNA-binding protein